MDSQTENQGVEYLQAFRTDRPLENISELVRRARKKCRIL